MIPNVKESSSKIKVRCLNCGTLNDENVKYCSECGESLFKDKNESKETNKVEKIEEEKNNSDDIYDKLREYKKLLDDGTLTKEEYDELKNRLLN